MPLSLIQNRKSEKTTMRCCPLCDATTVTHYHQDRRRDYYQCATCLLVFVPPEQHLNARDEKAEYDRHQNSPYDTGYRHFLGRLFTPLLAKLPAGANGLDFGAGPGPTLSLMFEEAGHPMAIYDVFYAPDTQVLTQPYAFITATEVLEHLAQPGKVLDQLLGLLLPGGYLGLMTKRVTTPAAFACWHYINDPTHVCFFSEATFRWWAEKHQLAVEFPGNDTVILRKH
ncbi:class I SAM-dependent methyltransferase [Vreelandella populi]|uniref:Class I SAM-dependent methyltransferase n=1 Tax=Vreelandella populi TaxID=2498858 RepID=A0A3S0ZE55_9GAMM|nr:class I SAM-dependent methyltransferase [Halomonas populi]RUR39160.1 class I SAM-dependent methyltransferase [Halomonas populi]RUR46275.1 class I SAM-dependent methyltransferase [Halomonas populi]